MKKYITIILFLTIASAVFMYSSAEEHISIHGGLTFGMTKDLVVEHEESYKTEYFIDGEKYIEDGYVMEYDKEEYYGIGDMRIVTSFAYNTSNLYFSFDDDKLVSVVVELCYSDHNRGEIRDSLKNKYGKPINEDNKYVYYPSKGHTATELFNNKKFKEQFNRDKLMLRLSDLQLEELDQYIVQIEGGYANIQYLGYTYREDYLKDIFGTIDESRKPSRPYQYIISYTYISNDEMKEYDENQKQLIEDRIKGEEQAKKAQENDL